jgi:hypothetical protein
MKLKDLIAHLQTKPEQEADVQFVIFTRADIGFCVVTCELEGAHTFEVMKALGKTTATRRAPQHTSNPKSAVKPGAPKLEPETAQLEPKPIPASLPPAALTPAWKKPPAPAPSSAAPEPADLGSLFEDTPSS